MKHFACQGVPRGISLEACCPCLAEACECDAGPSVLMLAEDGHCRYHAEAFRAVREYLDIRSRQDDERIWEEKCWRMRGCMRRLPVCRA